MKKLFKIIIHYKNLQGWYLQGIGKLEMKTETFYFDQFYTLGGIWNIESNSIRHLITTRVRNEAFKN